MLAVSSLGPVIITMKNGLLAHGLYLYTCEANSVWNFEWKHLCSILTVLPTLASPRPGLRLHPSLNSPGENGKQSEANCRTGTARHTQVEGEVLRALIGRSLAVSEQQLADGCEAEMIHTDSTVPVSVP